MVGTDRSNVSENIILKKLMDKLLGLYGEQHPSPFPYADCRKLLSKADDEKYEGFIPDLHLVIFDLG